VSEASQAYETFFREYHHPHQAADEAPFYLQLLEEIYAKGECNININMQNIFAFNPELYRQTVTYPQELVPVIDDILQRLLYKLVNPDDDAEVAAVLDARRPMQARAFNLISKHTMREMNPEDMDSLIAVRGMVIRVGGLLPEMQLAHFRCAQCAFEVTVGVDEGTIDEPAQCANCQARKSFVLDHNRCKYSDKQVGGALAVHCDSGRRGVHPLTRGALRAVDVVLTLLFSGVDRSRAARLDSRG
jgi:DNA replication licensing factor MCM4